MENNSIFIPFCAKSSLDENQISKAADKKLL